jgi:glycosyltransferase involved in cell wall biosynthesis
LRVLLVNDLPVDDPTGGGAEVYVGRLMSALRQAGHDVDLFAGQVRHEGAERLLDLWDRRARSTLVRRVVETRPDVVHFHNVVRELSVAALLVPAPRVLTAHDMRLAGTVDPRPPSIRGFVDRHVKRRIDTAVARRALDEIVAVSEPVADSLAAAGFLRVTTAPAPASLPTHPVESPADCTDLAYIGRLSEDKGLFVLLAAWRAISERHPASRLLIAGDGPLSGELAGIRDESVRYLGRLDGAGVSKLLGSVRGVIVPSLPGLRPEGAPLAVVEAAAHGRPVVGSDDPGIAALAGVLPGCILVPAGNVGALASQLGRLLCDSLHAAELGRLNAEAARVAHAPERLVNCMEQVYERAIAARRPSVRTREVAYSG